MGTRFIYNKSFGDAYKKTLTPYPEGDAIYLARYDTDSSEPDMSGRVRSLAAWEVIPADVVSSKVIQDGLRVLSYKKGAE